MWSKNSICHEIFILDTIGWYWLLIDKRFWILIGQNVDEFSRTALTVLICFHNNSSFAGMCKWKETILIIDKDLCNTYGRSLQCQRGKVVGHLPTLCLAVVFDYVVKSSQRVPYISSEVQQHTQATALNPEPQREMIQITGSYFFLSPSLHICIALCSSSAKGSSKAASSVPIY